MLMIFHGWIINWRKEWRYLNWSYYSGSLSVDEFMSLPELQQNPLVQRVIDILDVDGNGEIDFKEFIEGISQFSVKGWFALLKFQNNTSHPHSCTFFPPIFYFKSPPKIKVTLLTKLKVLQEFYPSPFSQDLMFYKFALFSDKLVNFNYNFSWLLIFSVNALLSNKKAYYYYRGCFRKNTELASSISNFNRVGWIGEIDGLDGTNCTIAFKIFEIEKNSVTKTGKFVEGKHEIPSPPPSLITR